MAAPLIALPFLGKALALAKGLTGLGKATAAVKAIPVMAAGVKGKGLLGAGRYAGSKLLNAGKFIWDKSGANTAERVMRLGPDALFGTMAAVNTPGDLGDKLIAGGTQAGLSLGLGLGASKLPGIRGTAMEGLADMGGSIAGDYAGMALGDSLQRLKGGGMTAWEREAQKQDELYRQQLEQEFLQKYGMLSQQPQVAYGNDPFLVQNGLG
mgnify:CR=1 FL=1